MKTKKSKSKVSKKATSSSSSSISYIDLLANINRIKKFDNKKINDKIDTNDNNNINNNNNNINNNNNNNDIINNDNDNDNNDDMNENIEKLQSSKKNLFEQLYPFGKDEINAFGKKSKIDEEDFVDFNEYDQKLPTPPPKISVKDSITSWNLLPELANILLNDGITHFSPVQRMVIPKLLSNNEYSSNIPPDMLVSAPTGSGKTLTYALPVMQTLMKRQSSVIRLQSLILLPSKELASQVFKVFCGLAKGSNIKVLLANGQRDFKEEQILLTGTVSVLEEEENHINWEKHYYSNDKYWSNPPGIFGSSTVHILICTPGRLSEHLNKTRGFTLQHLQFLVLDEADRLLANAYHDWIRQLITSTHSSGFNQYHIDSIYPNGINFTNFNPSVFNPFEPSNMIKQNFPRTQNLQRLLFSATITDNPRKFAMLGITSPLIFRAANTDINIPSLNNDANSDTILSSSGFILPLSLSESTIVCDAATRPLLMIGLILESFHDISITQNEIDENEDDKRKSKKGHVVCNKPTDMILIFSSSVDTTHRLCRLLQLFNGQTDGDNNSKNLKFGGKVSEMDSLMTSEQKEAIMNEAALGHIRVLVSSDNLSRGIDLPNIRIVVNYDAPKFAKTYVHRVGRTARADRPGLAITLLKAGQVGTFMKMRSTIGFNSDSKTTKVNKSSKRKKDEYGLITCKVDKNTLESISDDYKKSIKKLSKILIKECQGDYKAGDEIFTDDL